MCAGALCWRSRAYLTPTWPTHDIWELANLDADGRLTLEEFAIAMHLVTRRLAGDALLHVLPPSLARAQAQHIPHDTSRTTGSRAR